MNNINTEISAPKERDEFIDYLKGILIILVVLGHVIQFVIYQNKDFWDNCVFKLIYIFHMPFFMAISGYLAWPGILRTENVRLYIYKKFKSYIIPVFVWTTLYSFLTLCFKHSPQVKENIRFWFDNFAFSLWFLWALFASVSVVVLLSKYIKLNTVFLCGSILCVLILPDVGNSYLAKYLFPFFVLGGLFRSVKDVGRFYNLYLFIPVFVATAVLYGFWDKETYIYISHMQPLSAIWSLVAQRWITSLLGVIVMLMMLRALYLLLGTRIKSCFSLIGKQTLKIYILQGYVITVLSKLHIHQFQGFFESTAISVIGVAAIIVLCMVTTHLASKSMFCRRVFFGESFS